MDISLFSFFVFIIVCLLFVPVFGWILLSCLLAKSAMHGIVNRCCALLLFFFSCGLSFLGPVFGWLVHRCVTTSVATSVSPCRGCVFFLFMQRRSRTNSAK